MKAAKADREEVEKVQALYSLMEFLWDGRWNSDEDWRDWDDDNEDKIALLKLEEELKEYEGTDLDGHVDNRIILYEYFKRRFIEADEYGSIGRVLMNADVLIEQVCNPDLDYLDFNSEIKEALEFWNENHPDEDENTDNSEIPTD